MGWHGTLVLTHWLPKRWAVTHRAACVCDLLYSTSLMLFCFCLFVYLFCHLVLRMRDFVAHGKTVTYSGTQILEHTRFAWYYVVHNILYVNASQCSQKSRPRKQIRKMWKWTFYSILFTFILYIIFYHTLPTPHLPAHYNYIQSVQVCQNLG